MPRLEFRQESRTEEQAELDGLFERLAAERERDSEGQRDSEPEAGEWEHDSEVQLEEVFERLARERERDSEEGRDSPLEAAR